MKTNRYVIFAVVLMLVGFGVFCCHTIISVVYGFRDDYAKADAIVVYGNQVYKSGKLSARLQDRLDKSAELYRASYASTLIVSGGIDKNGTDEAQAMRRYLIERQNVDGSHIVADSDGYNTMRTAKFVVKYMSEHNYHSVICVSQYSHLLRAKLSLSTVGVKNIYRAHAKYRWQKSDFLTLPREFLAYYYYLLRY